MTTSTIKISELTDLTPFSASGKIPISSGGTTYSVTGQTLSDYVATNIANGPLSVNTATIGVGGLTVNGPVQFNSSFSFLGTATVVTSNSGTFYGDVNGVGALYAGVVGFSPLPSTVIQSAANVNAYIQNNFQNINSGVQASTEWVATANNGDDSNHYLDMGIAGGSWDGSQSNSVGTAASANDSWIYAQGSTSTSAGGNLILGTIKNGKSVKILAGPNGSSSVVATFSSSTIAFTKPLTVNGYAVSTQTFSTSTLVAQAVTATNWLGGTVSGTATVATFIGTATASSTQTGAVVVQGGLGVGGNLWANIVYSTNGYFSNGTSQIQINGTSLYLPGDLILNGASQIIKGQGGYTNITLNSGWNTAVRFASTATVAGTGDSTSSSTGALIVSGGAGIAKNVYVGGYVVQQALPAFRVYGNGGAVSATTTLTNSHFVVDYNQGSYLSTSTGVFTAPVAGIYQVNIVGRTNSNSSPSASQVIVYKNNTITAIMIEWAANTTVNHIGGSTAIKLAVGDTLKAVVTQGTISFDSNDNWSVAFLG